MTWTTTTRTNNMSSSKSEAITDTCLIMRRSAFCSLSSRRQRLSVVQHCWYVVPLLATMLGSCSNAWVVAPHRLGTISAAESCSHVRACCGLTATRSCCRYRPPTSSATPRHASFSTTTIACSASGGDGEEENGTPAAAVEEESRVDLRWSLRVATSAWQDRFASLRNDAGDPWSALSASSRHGMEDERQPATGVGSQQAQAVGVAMAEDAVADGPRRGRLRRRLTAAVASATSSTAVVDSNGEADVDVSLNPDDKSRNQGAADVVGGGAAGTTKKSPPPTKGQKQTSYSSSAAAVVGAGAETENQQSAVGDDEDDGRQTRQRRVIDEAAEVMQARGESDSAAARRGYLLLDAELAAVTVAPKQESSPSALASTNRAVAESPPAQAPLLTRLTAAALLAWIRCKTAGNGLVVSDNGEVATSDTLERRGLWADHAPRVLQLMKRVAKDPASDPELQQMYTEAVMYSVASKGIVEAFVTGQASAFSSATSSLVKKFPTQDNGVGFIFQGSYYLAAPWPIRSPKKALENFEKAVKINGRSRRNVYYAGLGRLSCGDRGGAAEMFRRAVSDEHCESASTTERDIAASLREQSQRGLNFCEKGAV